MIRILVSTVLFAGLLLTGAAPDSAAAEKSFRLGFLDSPGSGLCRIAALKGHYREEGLKVELVRFADNRSGLAALEHRTIDAGAFEVGEVLRAIARGIGFRIIAGGGVPTSTGPLAELDPDVQQKLDLTGSVVVIPPVGVASEKETVTRLTAALIRAYRSRQLQPDLLHNDPSGSDRTITVFNPAPDYYHLELLWRRLDLQTAAMPHDFLANHVYEEIYCDALDGLRDDAPEDQVFTELSRKVVCVPDCCPKNKKAK